MLLPRAVLCSKQEEKENCPPCSRSSSRPSLTPRLKGPCGICGGSPPPSLEDPEPSCGHWVKGLGQWGPAWQCKVCFTCLDFPPKGRYDDSSLTAPSCGHWSFSTKECGCRRPDNRWHRHICMVCIDFEPVTFTGLTTKCKAPRCGHWIWYDGGWISRGRYDQIQKEKEERKKLPEAQKDDDSATEKAAAAEAVVDLRRGYFTFAQFKKAYAASGSGC